MATKYWVGGTGTWDATTATNWSDSSGGAGGAIAPCALDDVVFNSASNATGYTVTINTGAVCRDITVAGPASGNVTVAGSVALYVFGNLLLPATGITRTLTGSIIFYGSGSQTITTNGIALASNIVFRGSGTYTLQDAITITGSITVFSGTLNTNGKTVTCSSSIGISGGTLTLGASTISASNWSAATGTLNAGTSNITLTSASGTFGNGTEFTGATFYNVTFSSSAISNLQIYGTNIFNNLTFTTASTAILSNIILYGNLTVNGTLTIAGQSAVNRYFLRSDTIGTTRTVAVATVGTLTDVDFRDITVAGASSPWSGTRLGDAGGNTNITFGAGATKYWNLAAGGAWTAAAWATSSGGAASALNFPLAQDTAIIENTGLNTSASITGFDLYNLKTLDCSTRTNAATLIGNNARINGNCVLSTSMTVSSLSVSFEGRAAQTITSAGRTFGSVIINNYASTVTLSGAYAGSSLTLTSGTFDTSNNNVTLSSLFSPTANSAAKTLTLGSSTVSVGTLFGNTATGVSNFTLNAGTSSITLSGGGNVGVNGVACAFNNVTLSTSATGAFYGTNTFNNLTFPTATSTGVTNITLFGNQTVSGTLALAGGTSVIQRLGIVSSALGTQRTITAATVTGLSDIDFRDINGAGAGTWTGGTRIGDCGGNSGIGFTAAKTVYWNLTGTQNWSATGWATTSSGAPAANNFPLAQDTATFTDAGSAGTITINAAWNIGTLDAAGRTAAMTLGHSATANVYGNVTYGSGLTISGGSSFGYTFSAPTTQTFTSAGKSTPNLIAVNHPSCVFRHGDAYTSTANITVTTGSYNTQSYNISAATFQSVSIPTRSVTLGTSTITVSSTTPINLTSTGLTFSGASSTINLSSASSKTFAGGGQTFGTVSNTGGTNTTALTITGSNTFATLSNTAYQDLTLTSGTTQTVTNFNYTGVVGNVVDINTTIPGLTATLQKASGAWYAGANSTDGGNNTGWLFTSGGSTNYAYIKDIIAIGGAVGTSSFFLMFGN